MFALSGQRLEYEGQFRLQGMIPLTTFICLPVYLPICLPACLLACLQVFFPSFQRTALLTTASPCCLPVIPSQRIACFVNGLAFEVSPRRPRPPGFGRQAFSVSTPLFHTSDKSDPLSTRRHFRADTVPMYVICKIRSCSPCEICMTRLSCAHVFRMESV